MARSGLMPGPGSERAGPASVRPTSSTTHPNLTTTKDIPMEIGTMLVIGLLVGIVAKFLLPGDDPGGLIVTTLLGIAGSFAAGYLGRAAGWYREGEPVGFIASV